MKKLHVLLSIFSLGFFLVLSSLAVQASTKMPEFSLKDVRSGSIVESSSFAGKVLYITFFATWCPPCVQEVSVLTQLQEELADSEFSVVGLSVDQEGPAVVARFADKNKINYPVLMTEFKTTKDFGGIFGIPVAFLVNKSGNIVKRYTGYVQHEILVKDIRSLLN